MAWSPPGWWFCGHLCLGSLGFAWLLLLSFSIRKKKHWPLFCTHPWLFGSFISHTFPYRQRRKQNTCICLKTLMAKDNTAGKSSFQRREKQAWRCLPNCLLSYISAGLRWGSKMQTQPLAQTNYFSSMVLWNTCRLQASALENPLFTIDWIDKLALKDKTFQTVYTSFFL